MKKLSVIPALLAVGWLSLAGTSKLLAQTNSTSTAQVESAQDGRQGEDRRDGEQIGAGERDTTRTGPASRPEGPAGPSAQARSATPSRPARSATSRPAGSSRSAPAS